jgi:hypothetical protein
MFKDLEHSNTGIRAVLNFFFIVQVDVLLGIKPQYENYQNTFHFISVYSEAELCTKPGKLDG